MHASSRFWSNYFSSFIVYNDQQKYECQSMIYKQDTKLTFFFSIRLIAFFWGGGIGGFIKCEQMCETFYHFYYIIKS